MTRRETTALNLLDRVLTGMVVNGHGKGNPCPRPLQAVYAKVKLATWDYYKHQARKFLPRDVRRHGRGWWIGMEA